MPSRRRPRLATCLVVIVWGAFPGLAWAGPRARGRAPSPRHPAAVWVRPEVFGRAVPPGFVGLSFEYGHLFPYTGTDPAAVNPVLVRLIGDLDPGGGFVLRVGGDSTDWSWWPIAGMAPPLTNAYPITPSWIAMMRALLAAVDGHTILGINLEAASARIAAAEAQALLAGLGRSRIEALEIGNEPESYSTRWYGWGRTAVPGRPRGYDFAAFLSEFERWRLALPAVPLAGPATGSLSWLAKVSRLLSAEPRLEQVTAHVYPLSNCGMSPSSPRYPTVANLLSTFASRSSVTALAPEVRLAHRRGRTFRVDELNSVTCQGRAGVSNTAASAVWALDTLFQMTAVGVDGVNFHMWPGAPANQLFTFARTNGRWAGSVRPIYYGLLMFARAAPAGARLLRAEVSGGPDVRAWATLAPDRRLRIVVINASPTSLRTVLVHPPRPAAATLQLLQPPSPYAIAGMTIAGQSFGTATETGLLTGPLQQTPLRPGDLYRLRLGPGSVAMLTLPDPPPRAGK